MRILLAVHHFPPRYNGGAEWRAYRTAAALQARGHRVNVVCVERVDAGRDGRVTWEDGTYEGVPVRRLSFDRAAAPDPWRWEYDNPWIGRHIEQVLIHQRPDVFHLFSGYLMSARPLLVARELGIPAVVSLTDFWFLCPRFSLWRTDGQLCAWPARAAACARCLGEEKRRYRLLGRVAPRLMDAFWGLQRGRVRRIGTRTRFLQRALRQASAVICPSQFLRSVFAQAGLDPRRLVAMRQGCDVPSPAPEPIDKTPATVLRVGYTGQLAPHKGVHLLFEALGRLPSAPLAVRAYGSPAAFPAYAARLQRLAQRDGRLSLAGVYRRQDVGRVLHELDVIVVPSLWYENSPNAILEAFAHRTPVVTADLGGMAELVRHEVDGLLFAPGRADSLAHQLRRLVEEPQLLPALRAGVRPVKGVGEEMTELEAVYRAVVEGATNLPRLGPAASQGGWS